MKKALRLLSLFLLLFIVGCQNQAEKEETFYDEQFIEDLAEGLDARWEEANKLANTALTGSDLASLVDLEYSQIENYRNLAFEDSSLQELAISYVNTLEEGKEIALLNDPLKWTEHQDKRTQILNEINQSYPIPVDDENILKELTAQGQNVSQKELIKDDVEKLVSTISFELVEDDGYGFRTYEAIVENTLDFTIATLSFTINLIDGEGVVVDNQYGYAENWKPGQSHRFEIFTDKDFKTTEIAVEYFEAEQ